jgi:hypothetical protein
MLPGRGAGLDWRYESDYPISNVIPEKDWESMIQDYELAVQDEGYDPDWIEGHWAEFPEEDPVVVTEWGSEQDYASGEFTAHLEDGFHRTAVALKLEQTTIPAFVGRLPPKAKNPGAIKARMLSWWPGSWPGTHAGP